MQITPTMFELDTSQDFLDEHRHCVIEMELCYLDGDNEYPSLEVEICKKN